VETVKLEDVALARYRLAAHLMPTPIEEAAGLGEQVWLKLENANKTHSFKIRGALNAMLSLDEAARARGIIAASSGNHAQGIACAARLLGVRAQIVMSHQAARRKVEGVRRWGGAPIFFGSYYGEAEGEARRLEREQALTWISPYNDPQVIAGQGTVGLEILDALPDVERVIVPVGGGGLISGIALALKQLRPSIEIIGVNPLNSPTMYNAYYESALVDQDDSIADALPGAIETDSMTIALTRRYVDRMVLVSEEEILAAMHWLLHVQGWIVEGGGAVGVAALQNGSVPQDGKRTCVVISGGNVDLSVLEQVIKVGHE
jgi:threonine dehydratase